MIRTHSGYSGSLSRREDSRNFRASSTVHEFRRRSFFRAFGSFASSATLPVTERVLGPEHPDTLAARANLAYWTEKVQDASDSSP